MHRNGPVAAEIGQQVHQRPGLFRGQAGDAEDGDGAQQFPSVP